MGQFSFWHLLLILIVVLVFFGPSRLPGLGNSLGKAIRGFKEGMRGDGDDDLEKEARKAHEPLTGKQETAEKNKKKESTEA